MVVVCDFWWMTIRFVGFCVSRFAACARNCDWRERKTQLWTRLLNFRICMFVKSAVTILFPCRFFHVSPKSWYSRDKIYAPGRFFFILYLLWLAICSLRFVSSVIGNPFNGRYIWWAKTYFVWGSNTDFPFFLSLFNSQLLQRLTVQTKLERREQLFLGC